ncbi:MAG: glucose-6-phosphate isomerase [Candidatus Latescibacteria bacterium]|nr:glucose-6-phosphate isomerase [Candidatus Latescibacterota bacterium]
MKKELIFDFSNLTVEMVGEHGISDNLVNSLMDKAKAIDADMQKRRKTGELPFRDLPYADIKALTEYAEKARGRFENFVNVGIGGSALGAQALFMALCHPFHNELDSRPGNGMRMYFADNVDPDRLTGIFDVCDPHKTLYNVITKSGSTAETMGAFLLVKNILEKAVGSSWKNHIVITTDKEKGDLRDIADSENITSFVVPDGVGGRFSVLCPVGLLPAACAGIDITELLAGAAAMDKRLRSADVPDNPAYLYSIYQYLLDIKSGKNISVMMPYSSGLYGLADWFRQLWAESLGKKHDLDGNIVNTGPTPVKALGVTDQHSQVQLYVEGPYDKVFTILAVDKFENDCLMEPSYKDKSSLGYLGGRSMAELMEAERLGTIYALTKNKRPNMTITFPGITPGTVGQFLYAFEVSIVFSGGLYNVNPLDQPGVEAGKIAAFALMGRSGYEDKAAEIKDGLKGNDKYVK